MSEDVSDRGLETIHLRLRTCHYVEKKKSLREACLGAKYRQGMFRVPTHKEVDERNWIRMLLSTSDF